ncbi:MAG: NHL repeat-containing protein [Eubacteriales bacterium]
MSEKLATELKIPKKKIKVSTYLNIVLGICLLLVIGFGWFYLRGTNPVQNVRDNIAVSSLPAPQYLYSIYGTPKEGLKAPWNTYSDGSRVYVIDSVNHRVLVLDYNGKYLSEIGKPQIKAGKVNAKPGDLSTPVGITMANGEIYVSDADTRRIHVFNQDGKFLRYFAGGKVALPATVYFKNGKFYVFDAFAHTLRVFDSTGKQLLAFGKRGAQEGDLNYSFGVYVDDNGNIYIADSNNNRIQVFDGQGKFKQVWKGQDADSSGGYSIPRGMAVDSKGNFYTAEALSSDIAVTKPDGSVATRFSYAEPPKDGVEDKLRAPTSVFIDPNQRLYVNDFGNSRVLVYKIRY